MHEKKEVLYIKINQYIKALWIYMKIELCCVAMDIFKMASKTPCGNIWKKSVCFFFSLFFPFFNSLYSNLFKVWSLKWSSKYYMLNYKSIYHFKILKIAAGKSKMALKMGKKS